MGALMGGGVGLTIGFIFGSWSIIKYVNLSPAACNILTPSSLLRGGAGPRGFLATLSQYMLSSAATFSFFLAIGSVSPLLSGSGIYVNFVSQVIRSDAMIPPHLQAAHLQLAPAFMVRSRAEGAQLMKARWDAERRRLAATKQ